MKVHKLVIFVLIICYVVVAPFYTSAQVEIRNKTTIVIDPGFGGEDTGPISCRKGIYAKDINLQIAKNLAGKIQNNSNPDPQ